MDTLTKSFGKLTIPLLVLLAISFWALPAQAKYGGGTGEPNDPYLIYTAEQMNEIGLSVNWDDWDKNFKLMADIDLSAYTGTSFNIIGYYVSWDNNKPFTGVFDGNGHTISNFSYTSTGRYRIGLFGYVTGEIKDLGLINPDVDAGTESWFVGSLVGSLSGGTITNCYAEGGSVAGSDVVGGLVGGNGEDSTITNCYATGSVSGYWYVGGLAGDNSGTISNCYASGTFSGDDNVGGLVGWNEGTITNCYAAGSVTGETQVGGLVGDNWEGTITNCYSTGSVSGNRWFVGGLVGDNSGTIFNCYSTGSVTGGNYVGGLVGSCVYYGTVFASFWDTETSGQTTSAGGKGKTTAEMQTASTFIGWGCEPVWTIDEGLDYPRLWWENKPGEPITNPFYGGGSGTQADPYLIYTADHLNMIALIPCHWDKHFKLMADIDLSAFTGTAFNIIGNYTTRFTGVFDGNGHTISNFTYSSTYANYLGIGFFGYIDDPNAEIKNLGLIDPNVDAGTRDYVGSLVGYLKDGTITNCYVEGGSVSGRYWVGGLVGRNYRGTITNSYSTGDVSGYGSVGGLVGENYGTITNCYAAGNVAGSSSWHGGVGGLVGSNGGTITNCYSTGSVSGNRQVGGLVGWNNNGTISNCYSEANDVSGNDFVGGLVGENYRGTINNCYSTGSVTGESSVGGLVGLNHGTITTCYSTGSVSGNDFVGGLVGYHDWGTISNCYSTGGVLGDYRVGGLVGRDASYGQVMHSFWDIETSGQTSSDGGTGLTTAEMQTASTFTDAGWDFTTPVWTIDEGIDYPRLWWELSPVLHAEPEITLGTSNTITWDPVPGANDYYAECAEDANFTKIIYNTGWITETSYEFIGFVPGRIYWYSVKARNIAGTETDWSNVESSLQVTLADAVDMMLAPDTLKNKNMKNALLNKINAVQQMIDEGLYEAALNKLQNDILQKTDGCAKTGQPDKNDWIITCEGQSRLYPLVIETIEHVRGLMNQ